MQKIVLTFVIFFYSLANYTAQQDSSQQINYKKRKIILTSSASTLVFSSLFYLNHAWYSEYNTGKFHLFDDNAEWLQMDKVGHVYTNYQMARLMMKSFKWAGFNKKQQMIYGGGIGFFYMTAMECMDGFSRGWGFSIGDQLCNALGMGIAVGQHALWNEQKICLKYSYSSSGLAKYNPNLLGENWATQILKDYNGQTYWLTANPFRFTKKQTKFPKWLNLALGYGADGMIGGHENKIVVIDEYGNALKFNRERRVYLSVDIDLTQLKPKNKTLEKLFSYFGLLKFPAPALEFSKQGTKFYYLYY